MYQMSNSALESDIADEQAEPAIPIDDIPASNQQDIHPDSEVPSRDVEATSGVEESTHLTDRAISVSSNALHAKVQGRSSSPTGLKGKIASLQAVIEAQVCLRLYFVLRCNRVVVYLNFRAK